MNFNLNGGGYKANLRELFYDRNPGDARVKVGSDRQAASSPNRAMGCLGEIGYTTIGMLSAGTLQNWRFHKEVCSDKGTRGYAGKAAKLLEGTLIKHFPPPPPVRTEL